MKPLHQRLLTWCGWLLAGVVTLGTILDAVGNALDLITRPVTYFGSAVLWLGWLVAQVRLKLRPVDWITTDGTRIRVSRLGVASLLPLTGATMLLWVPVLSAPTLLLSCPSTITANEATIAGTAPPHSRIALYVHPIDGSSAYWLQGDGKIDVGPDGTWRHVTRFGNPFGIGHRNPWPAFDVYALALGSTSVPPSPESISTNPNAARCSLKREPEPAIACGAHALRIRSPQPLTCPFAAHVLADPSCNPRELVKVRSPVVFSWEPEIEVFAELYRDGQPVTTLPKEFDGKFGVGNPVQSGLTAPLQPGEYEFKIARHKETYCKTSAWFLVVNQ